MLNASLRTDGGVASDLHLSTSDGDGDQAVDRSAAPFLPVATVAALFAGEDLVVEPPVRAEQVQGVRAAAAVLAGWLGRRPPRLHTCADPAEPPSVAPGQALLFTRGIDSWASLLAHRDAVTHLLFVDGVEPNHAPAVRAQVRAATAEAAAAAGRPLLCVTTDARDHLDPLTVWDHTHGAALVSAALLISPVLGTLQIASSHAPGTDRPWGTHPDLDPHWSTPRLTVEHDRQRGRWDKTALVAGSDAALATLHVCWEGGGDRNCGRCRKCLLTMTALAALSALDRCPRFDAPLRVDAIAALPTRPPGRNGNTKDLLAHLPPGSAWTQAWTEILPPEDR